MAKEGESNEISARHCAEAARRKWHLGVISVAKKYGNGIGVYVISIVATVNDESLDSSAVDV